MTSTDRSWTWVWDTLPGVAGFVGARMKVTDPTGSVVYTYTPHPQYGQRGWLTQAVRSWTDGTTASFGYAHDGAGRW